VAATAATVRIRRRSLSLKCMLDGNVDQGYDDRRIAGQALAAEGVGVQRKSYPASTDRRV
jgi:hypothetical protein